MKPSWFHVSTKKKKKKMKHNYFTSMTAFSNHWFSKKWKRKKKMLSLGIHFIQGFTCTYIQLCTLCAWYVPLLFDHAPRPSLPTHHIDIHRPLKQDVQKLVFSIKQCRALT